MPDKRYKPSDFHHAALKHFNNASDDLLEHVLTWIDSRKTLPTREECEARIKRSWYIGSTISDDVWNAIQSCFTAAQRLNGVELQEAA